MVRSGIKYTHGTNMPELFLFSFLFFCLFFFLSSCTITSFPTNQRP